jgi:tRNA (guanine26-N2/guanine27-N2)-dimethyltransferase
VAKKMVETEEKVPDGFSMIREGQAAMLLPTGNEVFYNKVQEFNRDLSVLMLRLFAERRLRDRTEKRLKKEGLSKEAIQERLAGVDWTAKVRDDDPDEDGMVVLDALAASGLRSIRYMKEVPGVKRVVVNDLDEAAVEQARRNVAFNRVDPARVVPQQGNANLVMYNAALGVPAEPFDVVDLDPYGAASPFLDAGVQAVADGGLLCVTCTDLSVLNGNHPETAYAKYRGMPTKGRYMHEMAVRIVLASIESHANRYKRYIEPLLSVAVDFYLRVFVRVHVSPAEVKKSVLKLSYVYQSLGCGTHYLQPVGRQNGHNFQPAHGPTCPELCPETGAKFRLGGPIYSAPMHHQEWVLEALTRAEAMRQGGPGYLNTRERLVGLLTAVSEELHDVPLFYALQDLSGTLHCSCPPLPQMHVRALPPPDCLIPDALSLHSSIKEGAVEGLKRVCLGLCVRVFVYLCVRRAR